FSMFNCHFSPTTAPRRVVRKNVTRLYPGHVLGWKLLLVPIASNQNVVSSRARFAAVQTIRRELTAVGKQCDLAFREELHFTDDTVAAAPLAAAARTSAKRIPHDANRANML